MDEDRRRGRSVPPSRVSMRKVRAVRGAEGLTTEITENHGDARRRTEKESIVTRAAPGETNLRVPPWFFVISVVKIFPAARTQANFPDRHRA